MVKMFIPNDYSERQKKLMEDSNEKFQKHMDEYWKEKKKKEDNRFRLTIIISIIGLIIALIALLLTYKKTTPQQMHKPDTIHQQVK